MKRFEGKVVVITGGGSGMGKISCTLFAQEGASVCVVDINEKTAKATADEIIAAGGKAKAYAIDICIWIRTSAFIMTVINSFQICQSHCAQTLRPVFMTRL